MIRTKIVLFIVILALVYFIVTIMRTGGVVFLKTVKLESEDTAAIKDGFPERIGEEIVYDVKLGKVRIGTARFSHLPKVELGGKLVSLMTFKTQLIRFTDLETIYSDPKNFFPIRVERNISTWPYAENIVEDYDQNNFLLTITKSKGRREDKSRIKKENAMHNAILLPFYVRRVPALKIGWTMAVSLPQQELEVKLVSVENISVPAGTFEAYRFESEPKKFEIWISSDERRIPLKIKGNGMLDYILVMREYSI